MYFFPWSFENLKISKGYQHEILGQPLRNKLFQKRIYPVELRLQLKTEKRKKELLLKYPNNPAKSYPYPDLIIKSMDLDSKIVNTFFKDFHLGNLNLLASLNDFRYFGETTRVANQFKDGVKLDVPPKAIIGPSISNLFNVLDFTPNFWHVPQSARYIPTKELPDLKLLLPKNKRTGKPNFLAFAYQIYTTLVEHSLKNPQPRKAFRMHGFLPYTEQQPGQPALSDADKDYLWKITVPKLALAISHPGSSFTFTETKVAYAIRNKRGGIDDAKITYNLTFVVPPIEGLDENSELQGGILQIPVSQYFVRLPFIWNPDEKDFEDLDSKLMREQAAILRTILLDSNYPEFVSCLFDISKEKNSKQLTEEYKTWQEILERDRQLWRDRYYAIGKDFFFPDWVLRLLQKVPTIEDLQVLPSEKTIAESNSTALRDSIFFPELDQSDETQLTPDEKLIGLALLFGVLDLKRDLIMNTNIFRPKKRKVPG